MSEAEPAEEGQGESPELDPKRFPSTRFERGAIAAKTGIKVGANYAKYLARRASRQGDTETLRKSLHDQNARDIFSELTKLRGTALKLAQGFSLDPGMLPEEFSQIMAQAQYSVPPMNQALVRRIIRKQLGAQPEKVFATFDLTAKAAASIGQVHVATLHDGRKVAVKVQYPNVAETIESDLKMAKGLAERIAPAMLKAGSAEPFIDEVRTMMRRETDYIQEGESIEFFSDQYAGEHIVTPRWVPELSTRSVLTMTFVEGQHLEDYLAGNPSQEERDAIGQVFWDFVHQQVASSNRTVHADAHPGNFLFRDDGRLGVLDFGAIKTFPESFLETFLLIFEAHLNGRTERLRGLYREVNILPPGLDPELADQIFSFFNRFAEIILYPYEKDDFDFGTNEFGERMTPLFKEASRFNVAVGSQHFVFVNRVLFGVVSMLTRLAPRIDVSRGKTWLLDAAERARLHREA